MSAKKVGVLAVITNEQCSEFVNPSKTAFTTETLLVDGGIEQAFAPAFGLFSVAFILANVGNDVMIETNFPCFQRIKGAVGIEERSGNRQTEALHATKSVLKVGLEVESIMMVACHDPSRGHHVALRIRDRQNIRGFGAFSVLIRDTLAAFLRQRMTPIEIQMRQIEVWADRLDALLPDPLQTAVSAPLLEVIVNRLPANLFFSGSVREGAIGSSGH